eukprot:PhF_6_TR27966/c0_g1_i5/m.41332
MHYACFLLLTVFALSSISTQQIVNITSMHHLCSLWNTSTANNTTNTATYYVVRNPGVWWNNTFMDDTDDTFCPIPIHHNITVLCEEDDAPLQCPPGSPCFTFVVQPMQNSPSRYNNTINVVGCKFVGSALIAEAVSEEQMERGVDVNLVNVDVDMNNSTKYGIAARWIGNVRLSHFTLSNGASRAVFMYNVSNFTMNFSTIRDCTSTGESGALLNVRTQEYLILEDSVFVNGSAVGNMGGKSSSVDVGGAVFLSSNNYTFIRRVVITAGYTQSITGGGCVGIYSRYVSVQSLSLKDCTSKEGNAGCMLIDSSSATLQNVDIENCYAYTVGGGIFLDFSSEGRYAFDTLNIVNTSSQQDPGFAALARVFDATTPPFTVS